MKKVSFIFITVLITTLLIGCSSNADSKQTPTLKTIATTSSVRPTPTLIPKPTATSESTRAKLRQWLDNAVADFYDPSEYSGKIVTQINKQKEAYIDYIITLLQKQSNGDMTLQELTDQIDEVIIQYRVYVFATIS